MWTPFFRSHEGNRPGDNWHWDGDAETLAHLARMTRAFVALRPYRRAVLAEYRNTGLPAQRPVSMHFPGTAMGRPSDYRWLLGRDLLAAPVLRPGRTTHDVSLPPGEWVHLWSGTRYDSDGAGGAGRTVRVAAGLGHPPVFWRAGSEWAETFDAVATAAEQA